MIVGRVVMAKDRIGMKIQKTKKTVNILMYLRARVTFEGPEIVGVPSLTTPRARQTG